jgi:hypothetical protein
MDLIQKVATVALLTMLTYFVMINILEKMGMNQELIQTDGNVAGAQLAGAQLAGAQQDECISNKLDLDANTGFGVNTNVGVTWNTVGEQAPAGGENLTQLSVYNDEAKGVLPVNHDLFEKPANFGSDITNINQFYRINPEIFERSMTTAPDAQSQEMFNNLANEAPNDQISAYNFETDPLSGISGNIL